MSKGIVGEKHDRRLEFNRDDFEVLDIALKEAPELRLCAGVLRAAREAKIEYPITSVKQLIKLLPEQQMYIEGHWLRPVLIERYMRQEYLPIENEQDLVARCHLALIRCREDVRWAVHAPPYASELLAELPAIPQTKGRA
ncbi:hypothetical protein [Geothrix fermentans]|uniref:hypothetical protein n=1 Tax=Geothrix fermentans TaxID=44676 RepID=UPI000478C8C1|nr:hypothetical protein [Geothrix fermentans]